MVVPKFQQYYASIEDMNPEQSGFYHAWVNEWQHGNAIDIDGQISYLFCYMYGVLENPTPTIIDELGKIQREYSNEPAIVFYCDRWMSDCYVLEGDFDKAVRVFPKLPLGSRSSYPTDDLLSLKLKIGQDASGVDIVTLIGPQITSAIKQYLPTIVDYINIKLAAQKRETSGNLLSMWALKSPTRPYGIFGSSRRVQQLSNKMITAYDFSKCTEVLDFVRKITRDAENAAREEAGLPNVGEGWIAETELYYQIKNALPQLIVEQHASPEWLGKQHLDIFISDLNVAIEYQGRQHDEPIAFFGGEEAFKRTQRRDIKKCNLCNSNGVKLIYVRSGYSLESLLKEITGAGQDTNLK